jgi:hypothetical protein
MQAGTLARAPSATTAWHPMAYSLCWVPRLAQVTAENSEHSPPSPPPPPTASSATQQAWALVQSLQLAGPASPKTDVEPVVEPEVAPEPEPVVAPDPAPEADPVVEPEPAPASVPQPEEIVAWAMQLSSAAQVPERHALALPRKALALQFGLLTDACVEVRLASVGAHSAAQSIMNAGLQVASFAQLAVQNCIAWAAEGCPPEPLVLPPELQPPNVARLARTIDEATR